MNTDVIKYLLDTRSRLKALAENAEKCLVACLPKDGTPVEWDDQGAHFKVWRQGSGIRVEFDGPIVDPIIKANVAAGKGPILGPPT